MKSMKNGCEKFWVELVDLAETNGQPDPKSHIANCSYCQESLKFLSLVFLSAQVKMYTPPAESVARAKAIAEFAPRTLKLARFVWMGQGARRQAQDFQCLYEEEGFEIRILVQPLSQGFDITGRAPEFVSKVTHQSQEIALTDDKYFHFVAKDLSESELLFEGDGRAYLMPAIEVMYDESGDS